MKNDLIATSKKSIRFIAQSLANSSSSYSIQRRALERLFQITSRDYNREAVLLRLTTLDAMYSANSKMVPYSLEDLADIIYNYGGERNAAAEFSKLLSNPSDIESILYHKVGYARKKDDGASRPSLVSKYAYFQMLCFKDWYPLGFPIYDDLVCKMLPLLISCSKTRLKKDVAYFFKCIDSLRTDLHLTKNDTCGLQEFDVIDAYLWRLGKLDSGNLSLLVDRDDYETLMKRVCFKEKKEASGELFFAKTKESYSNSFFSGVKESPVLLTLYNNYITLISYNNEKNS